LILPLFALLSFIDFSFCFGIATLLLIRGRKQAWVLILLLYALSLWAAIPWIAWIAPESSRLIVTRDLFMIAPWVPVCVMMFGLTMLELPLSSVWLKITFILSALFMILIGTPFFVKGILFTTVDIVPIPGPYFPTFIGYFSLVGLYSFTAIFRAYPKADLIQKKKLQWLALAFLCATIAAGVHFLAVYTGREPVPHDIFVMGFAGLLAYAILKRRLYDIQLLTRDAASNIATAVLTVLPLIVGRLLAPVAAELNQMAWIQTLSILFAALFFFSFAVTLVRYLDNRTAVHLCRVFLVIALLNAVLLTWAAPRDYFSLPLTRVLFLISGWVLLSWVDYRRDYFQQPSGKGITLYRMWRWSTYVIILLAVATPWVAKGLRVESSTMRPIGIVPGPMFRFFEYWWFVNFVVASAWVGNRFRKLLSGSPAASIAMLTVSMAIGILAGINFIHFATGHTPRPWFAFLEIIAGGAMTRTFLMQPQSGHKPTSFSLRTMLMSLMLSCIAGFMLFYGLWVQLAAGLLLVVSLPRIWTEVRESAQALVDRYLFREKFSYLSEIERIGEDMFRFTNLPGLLHFLADDLSRRTALAWVGVWLYDLSESRFLLREASGIKNTNLDRTELYKLSFDAKDALLQSFKQEHVLLVIDDLQASSKSGITVPEPSVSEQAVVEMQRTDLAAAFPLYLASRLIGFIGFGGKEDHSLFHQADRATLSELGAKAERAIGQSYMLYEQSLMFSKLAHDTLNFLHAMGMNMDILHNEYLGPLNEKQKRQLVIAAHQKELIRESLIDLRELERLMVLRIQGTWYMGPYNLSEVVGEALEVYEGRAKAIGIVIEKQLHAIQTAIGDARAVRRVIDNLLINALKYTSSGGKIRVELGQEGENLILRVSDSGAGIPAEEIGRIFDPFYRGPSGTAIARGTGLGLSVVREVANLHKGSVNVESTVGVGTTFTVKLPSSARHKEFAPAGDEMPSGEAAQVA
jgi:signal transduction histidine kinase